MTATISSVTAFLSINRLVRPHTTAKISTGLIQNGKAAAAVIVVARHPTIVVPVSSVRRLKKPENVHVSPRKNRSCRPSYPRRFFRKSIKRTFYPETDVRRDFRAVQNFFAYRKKKTNATNSVTYYRYDPTSPSRPPGRRKTRPDRFSKDFPSNERRRRRLVRFVHKSLARVFSTDDRT